MEPKILPYDQYTQLEVFGPNKKNEIVLRIHDDSHTHSTFLNLDQTSELIHYLEDCLREIRKNKETKPNE